MKIFLSFITLIFISTGFCQMPVKDNYIDEFRSQMKQNGHHICEESFFITTKRNVNKPKRHKKMDHTLRWVYNESYDTLKVCFFEKGAYSDTFRFEVYDSLGQPIVIWYLNMHPAYHVSQSFINNRLTVFVGNYNGEISKKEYRYDSEGRLIKCTHFKNDSLYNVQTYNYGDSIIVVTGTSECYKMYLDGTGHVIKKQYVLCDNMDSVWKETNYKYQNGRQIYLGQMNHSSGVRLIESTSYDTLGRVIFYSVQYPDKFQSARANERETQWTKTEYNPNGLIVRQIVNNGDRRKREVILYKYY